MLSYLIKQFIMGDVCFSFINILSFKPEFTIVISIHYKPRIAVAIPDL